MIILYDGVCTFCNATVNFVIRRDPKGRFRFAALQSAAASRLLHGRRLEPSDFDTLYLILPDGRVLERSTAILTILRSLKMPWPVLSVLLLVPRIIRDWAYRVFARRRYRWFGQRDECPIPPPEIRSRFISD